MRSSTSEPPPRFQESILQDLVRRLVQYAFHLASSHLSLLFVLSARRCSPYAHMCAAPASFAALPRFFVRRFAWVAWRRFASEPGSKKGTMRLPAGAPQRCSLVAASAGVAGDSSSRLKYLHDSPARRRRHRLTYKDYSPKITQTGSRHPAVSRFA